MDNQEKMIRMQKRRLDERKKDLQKFIDSFSETSARMKRTEEYIPQAMADLLDIKKISEEIKMLEGFLSDWDYLEDQGELQT